MIYTHYSADKEKTTDVHLVIDKTLITKDVNNYNFPKKNDFLGPPTKNTISQDVIV